MKLTRKSSTLIKKSLSISANSESRFSCYLAVMLQRGCILRTHLCGYDLNLTYPQTGGHFPSLRSPFNNSHNPLVVFGRGGSKGRYDLDYMARAAATFDLVKRADQAGRQGKSKRQRQNQNSSLTLDQWKQGHLSKGVLDPDYGCFLWEEMTDFAVNFTFPWCMSLSL